MASEESECPRLKSHTYVIDRDYRIVYLDRSARTVFSGGRIGSLCYEQLRGQYEPCKDCPWHPEKDEPVSQSLIYNANRGLWFEVTCLQLEWFDAGPCVLFSSRPVDDQSRGLLATLSQPSSYDELFELNLTSNEYKILYHETSMFVMPAAEGRLSDMFEEVSTVMIHPQDRERFVAFWNFDTLADRLEEAGGTLYAEFRKLLANGSWGWASQTVIPVKREGNNQTVIMCFVTDVDSKVRAREMAEETSRIRLLKERDQLTGLYNALTFYDKAEELVAANPNAPYEMAYVDIEHFKLYNEWYGREAGDRILRGLAAELAHSAHRYGGIAGYLGGDDFVLLMPQGSVTEEGVNRKAKQAPFDTEDTIGFQPAVGVCTIEPPDDSVIVASDHAMIAMNSVKGAYAKNFARYHAAMAQELENETKTLMEVKGALEQREFVLYWQPQCSTRTGRIVGAEALVRWNHPQRGIVAPGEFIPVLERNGFIATLDLYVWNEACRTIRSWIDRGHALIPVSVNISRADLYAIDVVEAIEDLVKRYNLDRSYLELEITESAYVEDERVTHAVNRLKELDYTVLMDDFGSGYSSLNMLKEINVDVLKIDMGFLDRNDNSQRSESILEAIVSMGRLMGLRIIVEGAETQEQVEFLKTVGCDYAQGYYFYRPMDTASFESLLLDDSLIDSRGILSPQIQTVSADTLLRDDELGRTVIDNLIGGMAVYAVHDDRFELVQVNNEYFRVTGCNPVDLRERQGLIWKQVHPEDLATVYAMFDEAEAHPVLGAKCIVRRFRLNGDLMWMSLHAFFLNRQEGKRLFYASVKDVTERRYSELASIGSVSTMGHVMEMFSARAVHHWCINLSRYSFLTEHDRALFKEHLGLQFEDWSCYSAHDVMQTAICAKPEDRQNIEAFLDGSRMLADFDQGVSSRSMEYRQAVDSESNLLLSRPPCTKTGDETKPTERWMELSYHLLRIPNSKDVYAYLYVVDIDRRKRRELQLQKEAEHDSLTGLLNRQAGSTRLKSLLAATASSGSIGAFAIIDLDDFKHINDGYGHLCGDMALADIGKHLSAAFRKHDMICRWGGDEFIVYCSGITRDGMERRVKELCEGSWQVDLPSGQSIELSVSVGVAVVPDHGTDFTEVYERADAALYQAKREGKAHFRTYEPGMRQQRSHS